MDFKKHPFSEIKWKVQELWWYADVLKKKFEWDIVVCLEGEVDIYHTDTDPIDRYVLVFGGQQIADCKVVIDHFNKNYFVSSIAILPNLQKNWIASKLYKDIIIPNMKNKYPEYPFVPAPEQTDAWKRLRKSQDGISQSLVVLDTQ